MCVVFNDCLHLKLWNTRPQKSIKQLFKRCSVITLSLLKLCWPVDFCTLKWTGRVFASQSNTHTGFGYISAVGVERKAADRPGVCACVCLCEVISIDWWSVVTWWVERVFLWTSCSSPLSLCAWSCISGNVDRWILDYRFRRSRPDNDARKPDEEVPLSVRWWTTKSTWTHLCQMNRSLCDEQEWFVIIWVEAAILCHVFAWWVVVQEVFFFLPVLIPGFEPACWAAAFNLFTRTFSPVTGLYRSLQFFKNV